MPSAGASPKLCWLPPQSACTWAVLCALCSALVSTSPLHAEQEVALAPASASLAKALETRGDLSLQDASMEKALITIGASWKVNIVVGKDVQGTVSCVYRRAPLREVLDAILLANGYSYRAVGDSIVVQKATEVGVANPLIQSAAVPIKHSDLQEIVAATKLLISNQGQVHALESSRSILVVDYADRVESIRSFIARMDAEAANSMGGLSPSSYKQLTVAYFHTQYIPVDNAKEPINSLLSQVGRVATMPDENRLVVVDYASNIEMVRKVLEKIDRPRPQVRITALIYDISIQDIENLGFDWDQSAFGNNLNVQGEPQEARTFDNTFTAITAGTPSGSATVQSLSRRFDITTVAKLLQEASDSRLLANPNVTVIENELAEWKSVQEIPFQQITQSELGGQIGTTAFKEVGITLRVRAAIAADGTIEMLVEPEFSRVAGFTENDNQPIVDTRNASTIVRVANRQTLVIGGLRQRSDTGDFNGIPVLKDMKYIGPLFRSRSTTVRESELLVFIMPEIVDYDQIPYPREYLAHETIACRLARVPMAEGCPSLNCASGDVSDRLMPLPQVDGEEFYLSSSAAASDAAAASVFKQQLPLRTAFGDRYRAEGGVDARHQPKIRSAHRPAPAREALIDRLFGSEQP